MKFIESTLADNKDYYLRYHCELHGGFDDFFEEIILESKHYLIRDSNQSIGGFAITKEGKLSCLFIIPEKCEIYEEVLDKVLQYDMVQGITTVSNDTRMITEVIKRNYKLVKQAYNFHFIDKNVESELIMKQALPEDLSSIELLFKDFLTDYKVKIHSGNLYLGYYNGEIISMGNMNPHTLNKNVVSLGLIVKESERGKGFGVQTMKSLIIEAQRRNACIQAGCWFYHHASKRALLNAGMSISGMIIRVDEF